MCLLQQKFVESLAAYSLFTHFAQVKDRHNGNIMIDSEGHILHIDYGFFFSNSPGRNMGFETAPFKLLQDFVSVMGGPDSDMFKYYRMLIFKGFLAARKHREAFVTLLRIAQADSKLPCFVGGESAFDAFEKRFQRGLTDEILMAHVDTVRSGSCCKMHCLLAMPACNACSCNACLQCLLTISLSLLGS